MMAKTFYGKLAATFSHPQHGTVRLALRPEFIDAMGTFEFFAYRKRGVEPSQIPAAVTDAVITWMEAQPDEVLFKIEPKPDFRYVRMKDGQAVCIPCSGYES